MTVSTILENAFNHHLAKSTIAHPWKKFFPTPMLLCV